MLLKRERRTGRIKGDRQSWENIESNHIHNINKKFTQKKITIQFFFDLDYSIQHKKERDRSKGMCERLKEETGKAQSQGKK